MLFLCGEQLRGPTDETNTDSGTKSLDDTFSVLGFILISSIGSILKTIFVMVLSLYLIRRADELFSQRPK